MRESAACPRLNPWLSHRARIRRITQETQGVATYDLVLDDLDVASRYEFQPGQFNMLYLPGAGEVAISVSGDPGNRSVIPHTIREAGNVTHVLSMYREGDIIGLRGPFGSCWPVEECAGRDVILAAGGIGLAPLRPVIYELMSHRDRFGAIWLLYGARTPQGLLYPGEFDHWRAQGIDVQTTVDRADATWRGNVGVVTLLLDRLRLERPQETILMTCGPEVMMWYTIQAAFRQGLLPTSAWVSLERNMNCAIGLCGHCQFGPEFICKDGPVFRYDRVAPILKINDL